MSGELEEVRAVDRDRWVADRDRWVADRLTEIERFANPERAAHGRGYHPTKLEICGASVPAVRSVGRACLPEFRGLTPRDRIGYAKGLVHSGSFEGAMLGYVLLDRDRAALTALEPEDLGREGEGLGAHVDNWVLTDTYGPWVLGMAWRYGRVTDEWMGNWVKDADPWYRRLTLTATIAWNARSRGGVGDAERTERFCAAAVDDRAPMMVKALSWALREWAGPQPEEVARFLATWDERLPALVRREVATRLRTGTKRGQ